jgi:hypothetical protein
LPYTDEEINFHNLKRKTLKKLLTICVKRSIFQFNGKYYDQIDGVSMGSPLGPLFANIFMDNFENKHIEQLEALGVKVWYRYVDDIFSVLDNNTKAEEILQYLNNQHPNIKFTIEKEKNNKLPFLDTQVNRRSNGYFTTIYRKKTFTGVYLNWTSLTSKKYKLGLIYCLLDRIWKITTDIEQRDLEIKTLKNILLKNQYPDKIIDQEIDKFLKNRIESSNNENINQQTTAKETSEKQKRFIVLPYAGDKSEEFSKRLRKLVNKNFPKIDLKVAYTTPNEIGKMFPFKDRISCIEKQSLVIYQISCIDCKAAYIGKTARILEHRIKEHKDSKKKDPSAVQLHLKNNPTHTIDFENIKILDHADSDYKLKMKEMLYINQLKPLLNTQHNCKFNSQVQTLIIAKH